jgi:hypothetical protein
VDATSKELTALVDAGDIDGLMQRVTLEEIADVWWRAKLRPETIEWNDPDFWALEFWMDPPLWEREDLLRRAILTLVERAPAQADLGHIGASILEVFINEDDERLRWVEEQAERSSAFRKALANVWISDLPSDVFLRVERAAGTELPWPAVGPPRPQPT